MRLLLKYLSALLLALAMLSLSGCSDPHVYGNIGISSGFGGYHGGHGSGISTSISIGGRIF